MTAVFDPYSSPINYIELRKQSGKGGAFLRSPGLAVVITPPALTYNITTPEGEGVTGAVPIWHGRALATFTIEFRLFSSGDVLLWQQFVSQIKYPEQLVLEVIGQAGIRVPAYDITHPQINSYGIRAAFIKEIGPLKQEPAKNLWTSTIDFLEFRRPRIAKGVVDNVKPPEDPDAAEAAALQTRIDAVEAATADKEKQIKTREAARLRNRELDKQVVDVQGDRGL